MRKLSYTDEQLLNLVNNTILQKTDYQIEDFTGGSVQITSTNNHQLAKYRVTLYFGYRNKNAVSYAVDIRAEFVTLWMEAIKLKTESLISQNDSMDFSEINALMNNIDISRPVEDEPISDDIVAIDEEVEEDIAETTTENIYCPPAEASDTLSATYKEIIDYLNNTLQANYKSTTKKTQTLIKSRIGEGFTIDDFKVVIDKKSVQWKHDSKMSVYLRPETLFGTKFEGYLNESRTKTAQTSDAMRAAQVKAESAGINMFALYDHLDNHLAQDMPTQPYNDGQINIFDAEVVDAN